MSPNALIKRMGVYCALASLSASAALAADGAAAHPEGWARDAVAAGVTLFDRGETEAARAKFEEVLASDPRDEAARYELTLTLSAEKRWDACVKEAETGLKYATQLRAAFFAIAGNCSDGAGRSGKAVRYFEKGLKEQPNDRQLLFNYAITLAQAGKHDRAVKQAEAAVTSAPSYASANFLLAQLYQQGGARVPAVLAFFGALELETETPRSVAASRAVVGLLKQGVTGGGDSGKNVRIEVSPQSKGGRIQSADLFLSLAAAGAHLSENEKKTEWENTLEALTKFFGVCRDMSLEKESDCFACGKFLPLFFELEKADLLPPFLYSALAGAAIPGSLEWAAAHAADRTRYEEWRKARTAQ